MTEHYFKNGDIFVKITANGKEVAVTTDGSEVYLSIEKAGDTDFYNDPANMYEHCTSHDFYNELQKAKKFFNNMMYDIYNHNNPL